MSVFLSSPVNYCFELTGNGYERFQSDSADGKLGDGVGVGGYPVFAKLTNWLSQSI